MSGRKDSGYAGRELPTLPWEVAVRFACQPVVELELLAPVHAPRTFSRTRDGIGGMELAAFEDHPPARCALDIDLCEMTGFRTGDAFALHG
jgi:hypothetical protein